MLFIWTRAQTRWRRFVVGVETRTYWVVAGIELWGVGRSANPLMPQMRGHEWGTRRARRKAIQSLGAIAISEAWGSSPAEPLAAAHLGHEALLHFAAAAAHGFEHLGHLGVLFEEAVDL
jgi:hypothetical protein